MSRFVYCNCPAGFGAGAERHAPDCPGRKLDKIAPTPVPETTGRYGCTCDCFAGAPGHSRDCPMWRPSISPADFGASKPAVIAPGYIKPSELPIWNCPAWSAQQEAFKELLRQAQQDSDEMRETCLLNALGMTAEEAVANRHRITRHCHPGQDVFLLDGEPVIAIHKPVFRGDEMVTSFQILRKPT